MTLYKKSVISCLSFLTYLIIYTCKFSNLPFDFINRKCFCGQFLSDNYILNINNSILETTIYTFSDQYNTASCLNLYDKMIKMYPISSKSYMGHFSVYNCWIGFKMIYRSHVTFSADKSSYKPLPYLFHIKYYLVAPITLDKCHA